MKKITGEYSVYKIVNTVNHKVYIGMTCQTLYARFHKHRSDARRNKTAMVLHHAMRKHGLENFSIELVRNDAQSYTELELQEIETITQFRADDPLFGYNISSGGGVSRQRIMVNDLIFESKTLAAQHFGLRDTVVIGRLSAGWSIDQAYGLLPPPSTKIITLDGKTFQTISDAAKARGIKPGTARERLLNGWTIEKAFEPVPPRSVVVEKAIKFERSGTSVVILGKSYRSISECARAFGLKKNSIVWRINALKEAPETAIMYFLKKSQELVETI